ncbi:MAG: EAL domain-containing protein [Azoarcus sp.]|jgi:EAL domain-containing protein (putative c-di-GMP-specific phosphodiesterase class I)|nr:EAL domain-containing protein [Azoarcus sp.]
MNTDPSPQNGNGRAAFVPDLSEGAEVGVYLALLELIDEGLIITGDECIIDANSAACRLLGRSYRQLAGQPLADLFADGRAFLDARERLLIRGEARGTLSLILPDGRAHDFPYIAAPRLRPGIHAIVIGNERPDACISPGLRPVQDGQPVLSLYFQPQIHVRSGAIHAVEALPRWLPQGQDSSASAHLADGSSDSDGCADAGFDARTLAAIFRAANTWPHIQNRAPAISLGIGAGQILDAALPALIGPALTASRLEPQRLELSIDARALSLPGSEAASILQALADMGVQLALDNFGRDPAPIAQLARHHFGTLKLDAAFAGQVGRNDNDTALIEAIVHMAAPLGIQVLARGVRNRAQQDFFLALGCELQQGPFIGATQDEHTFAVFLSNRFFCLT